MEMLVALKNLHNQIKNKASPKSHDNTEVVRALDMLMLFQ